MEPIHVAKTQRTPPGPFDRLLGCVIGQVAGLAIIALFGWLTGNLHILPGALVGGYLYALFCWYQDANHFYQARLASEQERRFHSAHAAALQRDAQSGVITPAEYRRRRVSREEDDDGQPVSAG